MQEKNRKFKVLYLKLIRNRFFKYFVSGVIATAGDWTMFYITAIVFRISYQLSLLSAFIVGTAINYSLNKFFTFQNVSKKIFRQFSVHFTISIVSLLFSLFIMYIFVERLLLEKMTSRIVTTFIMLFVNYSMHKNITFNARFTG
jgi:putative flippase GtrA